MNEKSPITHPDFCMWFTILVLGLAITFVIAHAFDCIYQSVECSCQDDEDEDEQ